MLFGDVGSALLEQLRLRHSEKSAIVFSRSGLTQKYDEGAYR